jgi:predicted dehydrogenase
MTAPGSGLGVAIVGAGMIGQAHAAGYRAVNAVEGPKLPPVRLVAIADINATLAQHVADRFGYERAETTWQAVAAAEDIDVVVVAVANPLHREVVEGMLAAGKHVLCEKPLAPTIADGEAMAAAAARAPGQQTAVGFSFRRNPAIAAIREYVNDGTLGRPLHFAGRYWCDYGAGPRGPMSWRYKGAPGSGALADIGSHLVDLAEFICGPIASVRGTVLSTSITERALPAGTAIGHAAAELSDIYEPVENEDVVSVTAAFASGASATLTATRISFGHPNALGFELFASEGAAKYDLERPGEFQLWDATPPGRTNGYRTVLAGPAQPYLSGGLPMNFPGVGFGQNDLFVWQARAFLEQVAGIEGNLPPVATLADGVRNLRLLAAIVESAQSGSEVKIT